jgi:hypothetical protein
MEKLGLEFNESNVAMVYCTKTIENCAAFPARIEAPQVAKILGFSEHDIPVLVRNGLLEPLGNPEERRNTKKYFAKYQIVFLAADVKWLNKASRVINQAWRDKNAGRSKANAVVELAAAA